MSAVKIASVCDFKKQPSEVRFFSEMITMHGDLLKLHAFEICYSHSSSLVTGALPPHFGHQRSLSIILSVSQE